MGQSQRLVDVGQRILQRTTPESLASAQGSGAGSLDVAGGAVNPHDHVAVQLLGALRPSRKPQRDGGGEQRGRGGWTLSEEVPAGERALSKRSGVLRRRKHLGLAKREQRQDAPLPWRVAAQPKLQTIHVTAE